MRYALSLQHEFIALYGTRDGSLWTIVNKIDTGQIDDSALVATVTEQASHWHSLSASFDLWLPEDIAMTSPGLDAGEIRIIAEEFVRAYHYPNYQVMVHYWARDDAPREDVASDASRLLVVPRVDFDEALSFAEGLGLEIDAVASAPSTHEIQDIQAAPLSELQIVDASSLTLDGNMTLASLFGEHTEPNAEFTSVSPAENNETDETADEPIVRADKSAPIEITDEKSAPLVTVLDDATSETPEPEAISTDVDKPTDEAPNAIVVPDDTKSDQSHESATIENADGQTADTKDATPRDGTEADDRGATTDETLAEPIYQTDDNRVIAAPSINTNEYAAAKPIVISDTAIKTPTTKIDADNVRPVLGLNAPQAQGLGRARIKRASRASKPARIYPLQSARPATFTPIAITENQRLGEPEHLILRGATGDVEQATAQIITSAGTSRHRPSFSLKRNFASIGAALAIGVVAFAALGLLRSVDFQTAPDPVVVQTEIDIDPQILDQIYAQTDDLLGIERAVSAPEDVPEPVAQDTTSAEGDLPTEEPAPEIATVADAPVEPDAEPIQTETQATTPDNTEPQPPTENIVIPEAPSDSPADDGTATRFAIASLARPASRPDDLIEVANDIVTEEPVTAPEEVEAPEEIAAPQDVPSESTSAIIDFEPFSVATRPENFVSPTDAPSVEQEPAPQPAVEVLEDTANAPRQDPVQGFAFARPPAARNNEQILAQARRVEANAIEAATSIAASTTSEASSASASNSDAPPPPPAADNLTPEQQEIAIDIANDDGEGPATAIGTGGAASEATMQGAIDTSEIALLGISGRANDPSAMIRKPNGDVLSVKKGDQVGEWKVIAINQDLVVVTRQGEQRSLRVPQF